MTSKQETSWSLNCCLQVTKHYIHTSTREENDFRFYLGKQTAFWENYTAKLYKTLVSLPYKSALLFLIIILLHVSPIISSVYVSKEKLL